MPTIDPTPEQLHAHITGQPLQRSMSMYASSADYWKEQAEANAKDAERYRWLRARVSGHRALGRGRPATFDFPGRMVLPPLGDIMRGSVAQHLDEAIDSALAETTSA